MGVAEAAIRAGQSAAVLNAADYALHVFPDAASPHDLRGIRGLRPYLVEDSTRVMNRIKALYRSRAVACAGTDVYKAQSREQWLTKLAGSGARARAEGPIWN